MPKRRPKKETCGFCGKKFVRNGDCWDAFDPECADRISEYMDDHDVDQDNAVAALRKQDAANKRRPIGHPRDLSKGQLEDIVWGAMTDLWMTAPEGQPFFYWDPDKTPRDDVAERLARALEKHGLKPKRRHTYTGS